jgi:S-(hydroxymethyl)glutathione dehydrogenase/alcohol dehydrogenase
MTIQTSRGAILTALGAPFEVVDLVWDDPQADEVGVRVISCGVCHSDWHAANGDYPVEYPILVGHEGVGIIERVGANVRRVGVGDHVVMSWMPSCGHCAWCSAGKGHLCDRGARLLSGERDDGTPRVRTTDGKAVRQMSFLGAFSDYVVIPEDGCIVIDDDFNLERIAPIGCRVPTGFGAATVMAGVGQGSTALVVGLGGVGMNVLQGLRAAGAIVIIAADRVDKREWAQDFGATHYIDTAKEDVLKEVRRITGIGVDYAFDAIGNEDVQSLCVEALHKGGRAVWVGAAPQSSRQIEINLQMVTLYEKTMGGVCYGGASPFTLVPELLALYRSGKVLIDELITHVYRLEDINVAFEDMLAGRNICGVVQY